MPPRGGGLDRAIVPVYDENNCIVGWALQVYGMEGIPDDLEVVTLTVTDSGNIAFDLNVGDDLIVSGDVGVAGNTNLQTLEAQSVISDLLNVTPNGGKFLQTSLTGIDTNAQVFIPDGASDVTEYIRIDALTTNGTTRSFLAFALQVGGTLTQNVVTGSETFQYRLNGDGSVDVRRTAGALTGRSVIRAMWV